MYFLAPKTLVKKPQGARHEGNRVARDWVIIYLLLAVLCGLWDLGSPTRDSIWAFSSESPES